MSDARRALNLFDTVMLVSGSMIGSGIFIVTADMTRVLGSPVLVLACWLLSGVITILAALSYGELAAMMPEAGGQFIYLRRAFGRLTGFVYGWTVFMVIQTGVIAAVAVAFAKFAGVFIPFFAETNMLARIGPFGVNSSQLLAIVSICFLTWLNTRGINNGKIVQRVFTSAKLVALLGLIVLGIVAASTQNYLRDNLALPFSPQVPGIGGGLAGAMGVALIGSLFSSDAWNNVTFIAGEIRRPSRNIPLGLILGVLIVTVLYILANVAYFMLLPALGSPDGANALERGIAYAENDRVGTAAMHNVLGAFSGYVMAFLIVISTFGCNNGLILQGARLFQSMAAQGLFFRNATPLNHRGVPAHALWMQAAWSSVLCLTGSYGSLLDYCTFASLVFYIVTVCGLFVLRKKEPLTPRPYKALGYPVLPALYVLLAGAVCVDLLLFRSANTLWGVVIMLSGIPVYFIFTRARAAVHP